MINQEDQDLELEFYKNRIIELEQCLTDILSMSKYISEPISRRINLCYNNSSTLESRPVSKDVIETTRLLTQEELPEELALKAWGLTYNNRSKRVDL